MKHFIIFFISFHCTIKTQASTILPKQISKESTKYILCKQHTIKYALFIKIAEIGLYLQQCNDKQYILDKPDKLIRFNYLVNVKAKVFIDAAEEFFIKNLENVIDTQDIQELNTFNALYENIRENEYYDLHHYKGEKLSLYKNSKLLGFSQNKSFNYKYFTIWFGKYPSVKKLKKSFL